MSQLNCDLCFVQETGISNANSIKSLSSAWRGSSFWSPAIGRQGGVAIFVAKDFNGEIISWRKDTSGRVLSIQIRLNQVNFNCVNIYAPTNPSERNSFYQSVHHFFYPHSRLIIGGDLNCYDNPRDKFGGNVSTSSELSSFKSCYNLVDSWRTKHPRAGSCTWFNSDMSIGSRLDSFLLVRDMLRSLSSCEILPCAYSDHDFVFLDLEIERVCNFGPGVWKFNNSLLSDQLYCDSIASIIDQHTRFKHVFSSIKELWEALKASIRQRSIEFAKTKRRELSREQVSITNRLIELKNSLVNGDSAAKDEILELESTLNALFTKEQDGVKIRSRAKWLEEGEKPSRFFFKLEREKFDKNFVYSVFNSNEEEVFSHSEIMNAHEEFYANLFSRDEIDPTTQSELLSNITASLSDKDRDSCEGELSIGELTNALNKMSKNKSPGPDGLTVEFYSKFWHSLGPILVDVINTCYSQSNLCESMKTSNTRLVFKKGDKRSLKNWRPISLLNVDYKICSKALSIRLSQVLENIVSPDQTCSVPGRSISSNLTTLRDMLDYVERTNETGILISLDQEKAFDRVDRSFLMNLLQRFGFGSSFCKWISVLYNGASMQVIVNGWLSRKIELHRGVRQGDSLSPMLYILCVEVLACQIRNTPDIEGFLLPGAKGKHFKVGQYADDTTGYVKNLRSLHKLFQVISLYERGSGAKLNKSKSEAMWLGAWRNRPDQPLGLTWVKKMKILGIFFGVVNVEQDNWEPKLSKLDKMLNRWKSRSLSMIGKTLILNILGVSKLLYLARVLVTPKWALERYNGLVWPFLWGSKIETVARKTLHCSVSKGGLGVVDFEAKGHALRLASTVASVNEASFNGYYLAKYFCGGRLARFNVKWACLRDNSTPSANLLTPFYSSSLKILEKLSYLPSSFNFNSRNTYLELRKEKTSPPILPRYWAPFVGTNFDLAKHWSHVRDPLTENFKSDLSWMITLRAVKVRDSLRNWGYIQSDKCASCPRKETIDHCFLNCARVKPVWLFFAPLLTALLSPGSSFSVNCTTVFFFRFPPASSKNQNIAVFIIKTVLYGIWKFRNKATFHNGRESSQAIIKYVVQEIKGRIRVDHFRLSQERFRKVWGHEALCENRDNTLIFKFT